MRDARAPAPATERAKRQHGSSRGRTHARRCRAALAISAPTRAQRARERVARRARRAAQLQRPSSFLSASTLRSCSCDRLAQPRDALRDTSRRRPAPRAAAGRAVARTRCAPRRASFSSAASSSPSTLRRMSSRPFCVSASTRGKPAGVGRRACAAVARRGSATAGAPGTLKNASRARFASRTCTASLDSDAACSCSPIRAPSRRASRRRRRAARRAHATQRDARSAQRAPMPRRCGRRIGMRAPV